MNLIRAYKLQQLGIKINPLHKEIIDYVNSKFDNLKRVNLYTGLTSYYFDKNNEYVFEFTYRDDLFIRYEGLWIVLEKHFAMNFLEINNFFKFIVETKFKYVIDEDNVYCKFSHDFNLLEEKYKKSYEPYQSL